MDLLQLLFDFPKNTNLITRLWKSLEDVYTNNFRRHAILGIPNGPKCLSVQTETETDRIFELGSVELSSGAPAGELGQDQAAWSNRARILDSPVVHCEYHGFWA